MSADKITTGAIRGIDIYGSQIRSSDGNTRMAITGGNIQLTQSNGNYVQVNPNGLIGYNSNKQRIFQANLQLVTSGALGTNTQNVYLAAQAGYEARVVRIDNIPSDGEPSTYNYLPVRAERVYVNAVTKNIASGGTHLYLQPTSGTEVRVTSETDLSSYQTFRAGTIAGTSIDINTQTTAVHLYGRPTSSGEFRVTVVGGTSNYRPVRARDFITDTSLRERKKDINVYSKNTLDIWRNAKIYTYHRLNDSANDKYQLGMMLDEMPSITHSETGDSFALYALTNYVGKGLKDLISYTDDIKDDVEWLKLENQYLKQK